MTNPTTHTLLSFALLLGCAAEVPAGGEPSAADDDKEMAAQLTHEGKADLFGGDICEQRGWYGDGDCDWFCAEPDPDCAAPPIGPEPEGDVTRHPIVFHHGFAGGHDWIFAWNAVEETLEEDGHVVEVTAVPPFDTVEVRTEYLREAVDRVLAETGAEKVNIIAHSMGGLDARHLVSALGYGDRVASITTISTPHRGTNVADLTLALTPGAADDAVDAFFRLVGRRISDAADSENVRGALIDLSEANADAFDAAHPDDPRVHYQSWAGVSSVLGLARYRDSAEVVEACEGRLFIHEGTFDRMRPEYWATAPAVAHFTERRPTDGLVSVESSRHGEFLGCIPADHSEEVGQYVGDDGPNRNTGFDHRRFYRNVAYDLAGRGF